MQIKSNTAQLDTAKINDIVLAGLKLRFILLLHCIGSRGYKQPPHQIVHLYKHTYIHTHSPTDSIHTSAVKVCIKIAVRKLLTNQIIINTAAYTAVVKVIKKNREKKKLILFERNYQQQQFVVKVLKSDNDKFITLLSILIHLNSQF